ncbi:MAG: hypothetical protein QM723_38695 [Myxococcaceae bacterium]
MAGAAADAGVGEARRVWTRPGLRTVASSPCATLMVCTPPNSVQCCDLTCQANVVNCVLGHGGIPGVGC